MDSGYSLLCMHTKQLLSDELLPLSNSNSDQPALLRSVFVNKKLNVGGAEEGIFRFSDWLPIRRRLQGSSAPVTYRSLHLAKVLGLENLFITFSGYWPKRGCTMTSGTFKECEAYVVCGRMPENFDRTLVVASAGNTARAFAKVCSDNDIPLLLIIPEQYSQAMWFSGKANPCVKLINIGDNGDYSDAINLADRLAALPQFIAEGGAKNVARRDGMGTTVLSAAHTLGGIPDYYFQAVGSGTGAIAAWEAALRLCEDGRYGDNQMKLFISQNEPFTPIHQSWQQKTRTFPELDAEASQSQIQQVLATVLTNRKPPYSIIGGLYDAMVDSDGQSNTVTNAELTVARQMFQQLEGIDISPEAGVALASLQKALKTHQINSRSRIMLNITGGGVETFMAENETVTMRADLNLSREQALHYSAEQIADKIFSKSD